QNKCERMDTSELSSPDARWFVRVYGKVCDLGIESSAAVIVDLALSESPDSAVTILSVDMPADKLGWPKPKWESSNRIIVQLPGSANIALQMAKVQNIEIALRFCPGGQAERDRWLVYKAAYRKWAGDVAAWARLSRQGAAGAKPAAPKALDGARP